MAVNDEIADELTRHSVGLQRLSNGTVRKIVAMLNRSDARIFERLLRDDVTEISRARLERMLEDLRKIIDSVYKDATGALQIELEGLATYEGEYQADMFKRVVPVRLEFVRPAADQIIAAVNARPFQGKLLKEWYSELEAGAFRRLRDTIRAGVVEGRTVDQIVRELRGTRAQGYKDGVLQINRRAAEATVRTAVAHTANVARDRVYERNAGLIKGVQWSATLDGRTSAVCRARDGTVYPVDSGPRPPAHPNCRSSTVPVLKSFRDLGLNIDAPKSTRASMNGQVAEDVTYDQWLRKQPIEFQNEVLGKAKGQLFRDGGLTMDRFVSKAGDELTLEELKQKEREAWTKAGLT